MANKIPTKDFHYLEVKVEGSPDKPIFLYYKDNVRCNRDEFNSCLEAIKEKVFKNG